MVSDLVGLGEAAYGIGAKPNRVDQPSDFTQLTSLSSPSFSMTGLGKASPTLSMTDPTWMNNLNQTFSGYQNLLGAVAPGFGDLSQLARTTIEGQRQSAVSNLQGELARRQMQGSSFAQGQISNTNADFAYQSFAAQAQAKVQELGLTQNILNAMANTSQNALNFELQSFGVAGDIANKVQAINGSLANTQMQLQYASNQIPSQMVGQGLGMVAGNNSSLGGMGSAGMPGGGSNMSSITGVLAGMGAFG